MDNSEKSFYSSHLQNLITLSKNVLCNVKWYFYQSGSSNWPLNCILEMDTIELL